MRNFSFQKQILTGFVLCVLFVFILAVVSYFSLRQVQSDAVWVDRTAEVINRLGLIENYVVTAESRQRAFVTNGNAESLQAYEKASDIIMPAVNELKILVQDDPKQSERVDSLEQYTLRKLEWIGSVVSARQNSFEEAQTLMQMGKGDILMDQIRNKISEISSDEKKLWAERKVISDTSVNRSVLIIMFGCLIALILILILFNYIRKTFREQKVVEESFREANAQLEKISRENRDKNWLLTGAANLGQAVREEHEAAVFKVDVLIARVLTELAQYLGAQVGAIYIADDSGQKLKFTFGYAYQAPRGSIPIFKLGEGMIGQAALDRNTIICAGIAEEHIKISSGLGTSVPKAILIQPLYAQGKLKGVIELGFASEVFPITLEFVEMVKEILGVEISTAQAKVRSQELFEQIQQQTEELESQQEELRTTNDELIHKTLQLETSEEELRVQQEELQQMNAELEEKAELLEERNKAVDEARKAIGIKAAELEKTSKYKSEFLANMSHELRTPLNSILILAGILKGNKYDNLSEEQVKYANVIHNAGNDLLTLINDILDLSKIESGKVDLTIEEVGMDEIRQDIELLFKEVANNKKISFYYKVNENVPKTLISDRVRLEQVLKNLLSNAFKFTSAKGSVSLEVSLAKPGHEFYTENLRSYDKPVLAFAVKDTGIGIPESKQRVIFEAFQQADGSTSRTYGGTGLGLSISKELANILGGELGVESQPGEGSIFTFFVPVSYQNEKVNDAMETPEAIAPELPAKSALQTPVKIADNTKSQFLLIVEDDENFAEILKSYAIERGFTPMLAHSGDKGLEMALKYQPEAILLDIMLPVVDGWEILKKLKDDPLTKNIPVHLMSAGDGKPGGGKHEGAIGFLKKPVNKEDLDGAFDLLIGENQFKLSKVLIIEDHKIQSKHLRDQLILQNIEVMQAFDGQEAMNILHKEQDFDCIILDLKLPDIAGLDLLDKIKAEKMLTDIPVVINTAMELDTESMSRVMKHTQAMVLKNKKSNYRLLDEVNLFLNKIKTEGKSAGSNMNLREKNSKNVSTQEKALKNKLVLIVDDDMRNIFALTSALQAYDLRIEIANNGNEALKKLEEKPEIDIVLMDIMMPEMDGYETMHEIRKQNRFAKLPIIALTAKAMKNDREKCIEAGANDYISKPVDMDKLLSMMRVWLS